jgi:hypothetical protein
MAVLGSDSKPLMIKGNRKGKTLGATGSWYKPENQEKYKNNLDAIWGKKETSNTKSKAV